MKFHPFSGVQSDVIHKILYRKKGKRLSQDYGKPINNTSNHNQTLGINATNGKIISIHKRSVSVARNNKIKKSLIQLKNSPLNLPPLSEELANKSKMNK